MKKEEQIRGRAQVRRRLSAPSQGKRCQVEEEKNRKEGVQGGGREKVQRELEPGWPMGETSRLSHAGN